MGVPQPAPGTRPALPDTEKPDMDHLKARPSEPPEDPLLVPGGSVLYESLTTRFIVFDRLLAALGEAAHSGYLRLLAPGASAILLLKDGNLLDCLCRQDASVCQGEEALRTVEGLVARGEGVLDVVSLPAEVVDGLHQLASGSIVHPEMHTSWVNVGGLVDFLRAREFTGTLEVDAPGDAGVIVFERGRVRGAFTQSSGVLSDHTDQVLDLCRDPATKIVVRATAGTSGGAESQPTGAAHDQLRL